MKTGTDFGFTDHLPVDLISSRAVRAREDVRKRRRGNAVFYAVFALAVAGWFLMLRPVRLGGPATFVVVQGVSMEPTYHTGDLVIAHRQASYAVGDVIAYRVPNGDVGAGLTVVHRITGGSAAAGFVTQGDNNPAPDDWRPTLADVQGKAWAVAPQGGALLTFLRAPIPLAALGASVVVAMIIYRDSAEPSRRRRRRTDLAEGDGADPEPEPEFGQGLGSDAPDGDLR
jgi:signal peptidase I